MSSRATGYLRSPRRAAEILIGADGRIMAPALAGLRVENEPETNEAAGIVDRAQARADEIVQAAMREAAAIQHDAYRDGRETGYRDGAANARAELADALALVQQIAFDARAVRDRLLWSAERDVIELVIDIAEAVLGEQVAVEPALVLETVERALARAGSQNVVRIRVHPDDREVVTVELTEQRGTALPFQIMGDHVVAIGGCVVDTQAGMVDARLDVQLAEIARVLRESVPDADQGWDGGRAGA